MTKRARVGFIYIFVVVATLLLRVGSSLGVYDALGVDGSQFFTCVVQLLIFGLLPIGAWLVGLAKSPEEKLKDFSSDFGIKKVSGRNFLRIILLTICMIIISSGISFVWQTVLSLIGYTRVSSSTDYSSLSVLFEQLALVALLPGIFEEVAHRGLLWAGFKDAGWKFVLVSAIYFSLMHQNIVQTGYTFFDGVLIALVMYYTGSIFPGIFMHVANNAVSVCSGYISQNGGVFNFINVFEDWLYSTIGGLVVCVVSVILACVITVLIFWRMRKDAVKAGLVGEIPFEKPKDNTILVKDGFFIATVVLGIGATVFSLVWGILR